MSDSTASDSPEIGEAHTQSLPDFGTLEELECRGRVVFLRTDPSLVAQVTPAVEHESPTDPGATVSSRAGRGVCSETLRRLLELEARVVVGTHLTGQLLADEGLRSLEELGLRLSEQLQIEVLVPDEYVGDAMKMVMGDLREGQVCLLPDLADNPGEVAGDEGFARSLSTYFDSYVGDAISASHLNYSSLARLPKLCARKALGLNARQELTALGRWSATPARRRLLVVGGEKFSDKIDLIDELLSHVGLLCLTGGVANTALSATGVTLGATEVEQAQFARARTLLVRARDLGVPVLLPSDVVVSEAGEVRLVEVGSVPAQASVVDIGEQSIKEIAQHLPQFDATLFWGPAGNVQSPSGRSATLALVGEQRPDGAIRLALGASLRAFLLTQEPQNYGGLSWIISGPQAAKVLLAKGTLPGVEALRSTR